MTRALLAALLLFACPGLRAEDAAPADEPSATAIEISGEAFYEAEAGALKPVELGQLFVEGDRLVTRDQGGMQLLLADGSTLTLGPNSELSVSRMGKGGAGSSSLFELVKGSVNAIVEKLTGGASFEIHTPHCVAAVKGTQFEVAADAAESAVTVQEGVVSMGDPEGRRSEAVEPFHRCSASQGRLNKSFALSKREAGEFEQRWARARMIHGQRHEIMKAFETHLHERKAALAARRAALRERRKEMRDKKPDGQRKKEMQERRKAARERFEKAREELKKERKRKPLNGG